MNRSSDVALLGQLGSRGFAEGDERLELERCRLPLALDAPGPGDGAVHQECRGNEQVARRDVWTMFLRNEPGAIGVRQQQVVELREEANRRPLVLAGPRRLRQVEQLAAALVTERDQLRSQRLEDRSRIGDARPRFQIVGARGPNAAR